MELFLTTIVLLTTGYPSFQAKLWHDKPIESCVAYVLPAIIGRPSTEVHLTCQDSAGEYFSRVVNGVMGA